MWNKLQERFEQFVAGRYGRDELFYVLLVLSLLLWVIGLFTAFIVLIVLGFLLMLLAFLRTLSRSSDARKRENEWALKVITPVRRWCKFWFIRIRDCRTHAYTHCPNCKAVIRFKRIKGVRKGVCPGCKTRFDVKILWEWPKKEDEL